MRRLIKILMAIAGTFSLTFAMALYISADLVLSADEFFTAVKRNDLDTAYNYLSKDLQSIATKTDLQNFLNSTAIPNYAKTDWTSQFMSRERGSLVGSVITENGSVFPIALGFVKDSSGWKIQTIQKSPPPV